MLTLLLAGIGLGLCVALILYCALERMATKTEEGTDETSRSDCGGV